MWGKIKVVGTVTRGTSGSAGLDLYSQEDYKDNGGVVLVSTGVRVMIPEGYVGIIKDRSGMAKKGVTTHGGVIDSDYRGEVGVMLRLNGNTIKKGDRIAQLVVVPCLMDFETVDSLDETERGEKGFGSTGN